MVVGSPAKGVRCPSGETVANHGSSIADTNVMCTSQLTEASLRKKPTNKGVCECHVCRRKRPTRNLTRNAWRTSTTRSRRQSKCDFARFVPLLTCLGTRLRESSWGDERGEDR